VAGQYCIKEFFHFFTIERFYKEIATAASDSIDGGLYDSPAIPGGAGIGVCHHNNGHFRPVLPDFFEQLKSVAGLRVRAFPGVYHVTGKNEVTTAAVNEINGTLFIVGKMASYAFASQQFEHEAGEFGIIIYNQYIGNVLLCAVSAFAVYLVITHFQHTPFYRKRPNS
jgi:hypothetical protein